MVVVSNLVMSAHFEGSMQLCLRELAASVLDVQLLALHKLNRSTLVQDSMSMCSNLYPVCNDLFGNRLGAPRSSFELESKSV
jgi:hypothetical protein